MNVLFLAIFAFCSWAVFSHKFDDGLLVKHLFIFAAILAFLRVLDRYNSATAIASSCCLVLGLLLWVFQHHKIIFKPRNQPR